MAETNPATGCQATALAEEMARTIAAYRRTDRASPKYAGRCRAGIERQVEQLADRLHAMEDAASHELAGSWAGALMQVALASAEADLLAIYAGSTEAERARRIDRLLASVMGFIEEAGGIRREDLGLDFYASRDLDPHAAVEKALAA